MLLVFPVNLCQYSAKQQIFWLATINDILACLYTHKIRLLQFLQSNNHI